MKEPMLTTLNNDFRHGFVKIFVQFQRSNSGLAGHVEVGKISMMKTTWEKSTLDHLDAKSLAILNKSSFESARSIG
jgi:hypothetical protein